MSEQTIIKETKYLLFKVIAQKPKTKVISIINKHYEEQIGTIEWYPDWRQYTFNPEIGTTWNIGCLADVIDVLNQLKEERNKDKAKGGI